MDLELQNSSRDKTMTTTEIQRVFEAQKMNRWTVAKTTATERIAKLKRLRQALFDQAPELQRAIQSDLRREGAETYLLEIHPTIAEINHTIKHLAKWMRPLKVATPLAMMGTQSFVKYEPKGVTLVIAPWNYPFSLMICPLINSVAAGNTAILKPSELAPATSRFVKKFVSEIFHENEVAVFEGDSSISQSLLELPFDHIFFTGGERVAKVVMTAAAKHLTPVTLELGGKSPVLIDDTANIRLAAERIIWGKFVNAGQTCVAPDYVLVPEKRLSDFCHGLQDTLTKFYGATEEARAKSPDLSRIVSPNHFKRIRALVEKSIEEGARLESGGLYNESEKYIAPTVLVNVGPEMAIMKEEIFGPVLPIITYRSRNEAYELINSKDKPLALYIFSGDSVITDEILLNTTAGGTAVNDTLAHLGNPNLPFGGIGTSGIGNYHGVFGFRTFSHERAVFKQSRFSALKFLYPPYTQRVKKLIQFITRWLA